MYNVLVVKVSVVGISCFSGLRLASGYSLNWLPVTERFKKKLLDSILARCYMVW